jgi:hypothetical protein
MAIGDDYATLAELRYRIGEGLSDEDTTNDAALTRALTTASRAVEDFCGRQFNTDAAATARVYAADACEVVYIDDFSTTVGLTVAADSSLWDVGDYQPEPLNGINAGRTGWPYYRIRAVGALSWPVSSKALVSVTAMWGWASVPVSIKEAVLILAQETWMLKQAPFGMAGSDEFGTTPMMRFNPRVIALLKPYQRNEVRLG